MRRSTALIGLALGLLVLFLGAGGTLALWTAQANHSGNQFTSGTLVLQAIRDRGEWTDGPMFYATAADGLYPAGLWQPGHSHDHVLHVFNTGSIDAVLSGIQAAYVSGNAALADWLNVEVTAPDPFNPASQIEVANTTLADLLAGAVTLAYSGSGDPVELFAGDIGELRFTVTMRTDTPDSFQGQDLQVHLTVLGEQMP